jgi:hypothetical protein
LATALHAQETPPASAVLSPAPQVIVPSTMTGCVSASPEKSGTYKFAEADSARELQIEGKGLRKWAGKRVELTLGHSPDGLTVKSGLFPPYSGGARGVALDPAQESVLRQPGGGGTGTGGNLSELHVLKVRPVAGVPCK